MRLLGSGVFAQFAPARRPYFVLNIRHPPQDKHRLTMAAPVEERISVPIDDPNADTEWYISSHFPLPSY
jgi:hypothetical protein